MNPSAANNIIISYASRQGYPTVAQAQDMEHSDFLKGLEIWPTEYITALPDAGLHYKLNGKVQHPQTGQIVRSEWGWKMEQVQKTLEFRNSTEGKKYVLRSITPVAVRNEDTDVNDMLNTVSIKVSATTGSAKSDKKQTQINIERLTHISALEKSISAGGALRTMYDATLKAHKNGIENLMTNEDAAKAAMYSKRRKRIPALLLSWLVMPLYVILRAFDMFFDGGIISAKMGYQGLALGPKVGSNHPFLGRFSIPIVVATFISFVSAITKYNAGVENYVKHGIVVSGIIMIPLYMIGFIILKQFFDIPFIILTNKYGIIAEWASHKFNPTAAEEFQLGGVTQTYEQQDILGRMIKEREALIRDLKISIENNIPYAKCDTLCKDKKFSLKTLEKEDGDVIGIS
ncbi:hypothetical protein [Anaerocolumna xylanovorans]|uniref:Uncharacterized protein n=1 Tax=Anaerocolumna xylanovorans DSM 12503 TaxID=1121345 RepID=A0A1M7YLD7_9FIRM|nr:hypothetical protein [Anaerocolumna xylanovorans]SHO53424.1 hypothetical protein SAMN02745217_04113 [Anaerocolumna xylanovorans DSM 12503]